MRVKTTLSVGQRVQIVNPVSFYHEEFGSIIAYDAPTDKYVVRLDIGYVIAISFSDVIKQLNKEELTEVYKGQLMQIADLALQYGDKEWFNEACSVLNKIK